MRGIFVLIMSLSILSTSLFTGSNTLYGVCETFLEAHYNHNLDIPKITKLIEAMGAKSFRNWVHITWFLKDENTVNEDSLKLEKEWIRLLKEAGIKKIVGMSHTWFLPKEANSTDPLSTPKRDMTPGSTYMKFLEMYETSWYTMAKALPEITHWEIGNEPNNNPFLHPINYNENPSVNIFSREEKADITTDMLFYASRGVHRANKDAVVILPGLAPVGGITEFDMEVFLRLIYINIKSGKFGNGSTKTDDYFEALAWHPYWWGEFDAERWVSYNDRLFAIAKKYGDGDKKVYFTEYGFSDDGNHENDYKQAKWLEQSFKIVKEKMSYVDSIYAFRTLEDESLAGKGGESSSYDGFFAVYGKDGFMPKYKAFALQRAFGGKGNLNMFVPVGKRVYDENNNRVKNN